MQLIQKTTNKVEIRPQIGLTIIVLIVFNVLMLSCEKNQDDDILKDIDGNQYETIQIGSQIWMAENLRVTRTPNGDTAVSYCYGDREENCELFGRLYTWETAFHVCPKGWHLPSDEEWQQLEVELGLTTEEASLWGWRGSLHGDLLKEGGTSGFNAQLAGYKDGTVFWDGRYFDMGYFGAFWTRTQYDSLRAVAYFVYALYPSVLRGDYDKTAAFSVRCIKDD